MAENFLSFQRFVLLFEPNDKKFDHYISQSNVKTWSPKFICLILLVYGLTTLAEFIYPEITQEQFLGK